ncbi:unnamed protein product [Onchocerca flexuosa]|uniref:Uncharacterized protein n=1 Tax=Onchocerca flexuosa TaxID=387005 RepID=A0A183HXB8_9BILA|nr:unnamed protein product [Onchocerca flexuosa]
MPAEIIKLQSYHPETWTDQEGFHRRGFFYPNEEIPYKLKDDKLENFSTTSTIATVSNTTILATNNITVTTTTIVSNTFSDKISMPILENDKPSYQSLLFRNNTELMKIRKPNNSRSSERHNAVNLNANIIVTKTKNRKTVASNNRRSATKSQHYFAADESNFGKKSVTLRTLRQNLATLKLHQHIEQLPLNDDDLMNIKRKQEQATQMKLLREVTFPNDVKVVGLAMQRELLYVATNDGQITMINPKTGKQVLIDNIGSLFFFF